MTWPEAGFDDHAIRGSLADIARLATVIENKLAAALPGTSIPIREEFAADSPFELILEVTEDGFDPASADQALPAEDAC
jgi:mRNA-degrading endonuclease toxin of MazEF toxin-antitoxin module